jgi:hypothetical protein
MKYTPLSLEDKLYEICDQEHSSCNSNCPVYRLNDNEVPKDRKEDNCSCFKNPTAMKNFIEKKEKETGEEITIS